MILLDFFRRARLRPFTLMLMSWMSRGEDMMSGAVGVVFGFVIEWMEQRFSSFSSPSSQCFWFLSSVFGLCRR